MYNFSYFKENDLETLVRFIEDHPFAFITGSTLSGAQVATQIPMVLVQKEDGLYVQGHIMRNTDHHAAFMENAQCLVVFTGASAYVSASWYTDQRMGSTWNYMSIHIYGKCRIMDVHELEQLMRMFTLKHENGNMESLTIYDNLPKDYTDKMMKGIVGIEIKVERLENVFKLSQNRDEKSYENIIQKLEEKGGDASKIAEEMRRRKARLFGKEGKKADVDA